MIIFGSRGMTTTADAGSFHCPRCGPARRYELKQVRRWFTLYFIPVIPLNKAGEYVECKQCAGTFGKEAIHYDPAEEKERIAREIQRVLVLLLAKTGVTEERISRLRGALSRTAGLQFDHEPMRDELALAARAPGTLAALLKGSETIFSEAGRALLMAEGYRMLAEGGRLAPDDEKAFREFMAAMGMTGSHQNATLEQLRRQSS